MAIDAYELYNSRKVNVGFDKQSAELSFFCRGTTDDVLARAAIIAITPLLFFGLEFRDLDIDPLGGGCWLGLAKYDSRVPTSNPGQGGASPPPPSPPAPGPTDPLGSGFAFDISVFTENIKLAKQTISRTKRGGGVAPDTKNLIGVTADGEVKGCDRLSPKFEWSVTRKFGFVTLDYYKNLVHMVGTTNLDPWYGFEAGEHLCIGASGSGKDTANIEVTLKFATQLNETDIVICDGLTVPFKGGWHYLDVAYLNQPSGAALTMQPEYAYVFRIYGAADYTIFSIGS